MLVHQNHTGAIFNFRVTFFAYQFIIELNKGFFKRHLVAFGIKRGHTGKYRFKMLLIKLYNLLIAAIKDAKERGIASDVKEERKTVSIASFPSLYAAGAVRDALVLIALSIQIFLH